MGESELGQGESYTNMQQGNLKAQVVIALLLISPLARGRPTPSIALTLPALSQTTLLWIGVGAVGGAGVALGAQGVANIAQAGVRYAGQVLDRILPDNQGNNDNNVI